MSGTEGSNPYDAPHSDVGTGHLAGVPESQRWSPGDAMRFGFRLTFKRPISIVVVLIGVVLSSLLPLAPYAAILLPVQDRPSEEQLPRIAMFAASLLVVLPIQAYLIFGTVRFALAVARGVDAGLERLFAPTHFPAFLATFVLILACSSFSLFFSCCLCAPGLLVAVPLGVFVAIAVAPFPFLICDGRSGVFSSFGGAWALTKSHRWSVVTYFLLCGAAAVAGIAALLVGITVALPACLLGFAYAYLKMCGEEPVRID